MGLVVYAWFCSGLLLVSGCFAVYVFWWLRGVCGFVCVWFVLVFVFALTAFRFVVVIVCDLDWFTVAALVLVILLCF